MTTNYKRQKTREEEQRAWLERRDREREEAARKAELQRPPTPGFRRLVLEDEGY